MFRNLERPVPVGPVGSDQRVATITKQLRIEKDIQLLGRYISRTSTFRAKALEPPFVAKLLIGCLYYIGDIIYYIPQNVVFLSLSLLTACIFFVKTVTVIFLIQYSVNVYRGQGFATRGQRWQIFVDKHLTYIY